MSERNSSSCKYLLITWKIIVGAVKRKKIILWSAMLHKVQTDNVIIGCLKHNSWPLRTDLLFKLFIYVLPIMLQYISYLHRVYACIHNFFTEFHEGTVDEKKIMKNVGNWLSLKILMMKLLCCVKNYTFSFFSRVPVLEVIFFENQMARRQMRNEGLNRFPRLIIFTQFLPIAR